MNDFNTPQPTQHKSISIIKLTALVVAVIVIAAGLFYFLVQKKPATISPAKPEPHQHTFSKLDSYTILGQAAGQGIYFEKPVEMPTIDSQGQLHIRSTQDMYYYLIASGVANKATDAGKVMVQSAYTPTPPSADALKLMRVDAKNPSSSTAKSLKSLLSNFVVQRLANYNVSLAELKPLVTKNLPDNAWQASYAATAKDPAQAKFYPNQKGIAVVAIGKSTYYFYAINTIDYNWTNSHNQKVWQQVFNSLKIDQ